MKVRELMPAQNHFFAALVVALLLTLGFVASFQANAEILLGPWRNAGDVESCPVGTICAEWPNEVRGIIEVCCIAPEDLGTLNYTSGCAVYLGQRVY